MDMKLAFSGLLTSRRTLTVAVVLCLIGLFAYDLLVLERSHVATLAIPATEKTFRSELKIRELAYEPAEGTMVGNLDIKILTADESFIFNQDVGISVRATGSGDSWRRTFLQLSQGDQREHGECSFVAPSASEYSDALRDYKASAEYICTGVVFADDLKSEEVWYPFDSYGASLSFKICVNSQGACLGDQALLVSVSSIKADAGPNSHFVTQLSGQSEASVTLNLKRRFFLKLVSALFLVIAVVFVIYMTLSPDPKDTLTKSLALLGGLWGMRTVVVPSTIKVFPSVVDGTVLAMFAIVFAIVLIRTTLKPPDKGVQT